MTADGRRLAIHPLPVDPSQDRLVMTPATVALVPNTPGTPRRTIRVPDALWAAAAAKAQEQGTDLSSLLRKYLERYVKRN